MLNWQAHKKLRIFIKTICIVLIVCFLAYDLSWAKAGEVLGSKSWQPSEQSNPSAIDIPQELGVIKDSYTSKYNSSRLVIHIQDAHANPEAQENESRLIKYLKDKYKANLVSVEGGFGEFDADFFRSFPKDKKIREKIAKYFLSKAFISGTDYLLITEDKPPVIYGAEDKELYASHLNAFKDNQRISESLNPSFGVIEEVITTLKNKYYSKDLKELDSRSSDFKEGRISLEEYLSYLNIASIINNFNLSEYPNLSRIISLQELETRINFDQAEIERQQLIDVLTKALSKSDLEELVKKSLDFKVDKIKPAEYYTYLEELTDKAKIPTSAYNNLFSYIKYIRLSENLDNSRLFAEVDDFTQALKEKLITNSVQKDLDSLTYIIRILKGLSSINLSPKDYEYFKKNRGAFNSKNLILTLKKYTNSRVLSSLPTDGDIASLDKFYSLAYDRDKAMVGNSLNRMNRDYSANSLILVAGGFHTQGITSILKEKDISYVVVAPNIKASQDKETVYFSYLKDKKLPLEDVLNDPDTLQIINSISDPQARQVLINYWIARSTRYYPTREIQAQLSRLRLSAEDQKAVELALGEFAPATVIAKKEQKESSSPITPRQPRKDKTSLIAKEPTKPKDIQVTVSTSIQPGYLSQALTAFKKKARKIFLSLAIASILFTSQPAAAHYFAANPEGAPQAIVQVWHRDTPAEDTLGGIGRDVLLAQGKKPTAALLYGRDGIVEQLASVNNLANPNLLRPNQPVTLPTLDTQAANKLLGRTEVQPTVVTPVQQTPQVTTASAQPEKTPAPEVPVKVTAPSQSQAPETPPASIQREDKSQTEKRLVEVEHQLSQAQQENQAAKQAVEHLTVEQKKAEGRISSLEQDSQSLEQKVSDLEKRFDTAEQQVTQAEEKHPEFREYAANWWKGLNSGWKAALSILAAFGAGLGFMRLYVYRKWSRIRELRDDIRRRQADKDRLDEEIDASQEQLAAVRADLERSQRALEEAEQKRKVQEEVLAKTQARSDTLETTPSGDDSLRQAIEQLEREVASRKSTIAKEISDEEGRLSRLRKELENLEKEHRHYEERIAQLQSQAKALEDELRVLEQTKASQEAQIQEETASARSQLAETQQAVLKAQQNLSALAVNLESLQVKKKESEDALVSLEGKKDALEKELSGLSRQQEELVQAIADLNSRKEELARQQQALDQAVDDRQKELADLERKIKGLETKGAREDTQIVSLKERKKNLETEISKLSQDISGLYKERGQSAQETERLRTYLSALEKQKQESEAAIHAFEDDRRNLSAEVSALQAQHRDLAAEVRRIEQNAASFQQDSQTKTASLDAETAQRQRQLEELRTKAASLAAQKTQLEQELSDLSRRKQQETQALEQALKQKQEIEERIASLNTQLEEVRQEVSNLTVHLDELKAREVSLDTEVPALTRKREALEEETSRLQRTKEELEQRVSVFSAEVRPAGVKPTPLELAKPYSVMMFDIDDTLTNTVTDIDRSMLGELIVFLEKGAYIVLISMQGKDEIYKHIVEPFYSYYGAKKELLERLIIYTAGGAECYRFDKGGNIFKEKAYDPLKNSVFEKEIPGDDDHDKEWNQAFVEDAVKARLAEHGYRNINLTNVRQNPLKRHGAITISVRKQEDRSKVSAILTDLFSEKGWHLQPRSGGRHTVHVLIGGVNKATAAEHSLRIIEHDAGAKIPYEQVFFAGDSFSAGGLDTDVISVLPGGHIVSVGRKPERDVLKNLQKLGIVFSEDLVGERNWPATYKILLEIEKGKRINDIGKDRSSDSGFGKVLRSILPVMFATFSFFPSFVSYADYVTVSPEARAQIERAVIVADTKSEDSLTESLDAVFTQYNYENDIAKINKAIELIRSKKVSDSRIIKVLQWVIVEADTSDNKFYPDTTLQASLALMDLGSSGQEALAKILRNPELLNKAVRLLKVLDAVSKTKSHSTAILDSLQWLAFKAYAGRETYDADVVRTVAAILLSDGGTNRIIDSLTPENYLARCILPAVFEAIKDSNVSDQGLISKLYWIVTDAVLEGGYYLDGTIPPAARALYRIKTNEALNKFKRALSRSDWRGRDGAAEAIIAIATEQGERVTPEVKTALEQVVALGSGHDFRQIAVRKAKALLEKIPLKPGSGKVEMVELAPLEVSKPIPHPPVPPPPPKTKVITTPAPAPAAAEPITLGMYQENPQKVIQILDQIVSNRDDNLTEKTKQVLLYSNADRSVHPDVIKKAVSILSSYYGGRLTLAELFTSENYQNNPAALLTVINALSSDVLEKPNLSIGENFLKALARIVIEPSSGGNYYPDINSAAINKLDELCQGSYSSSRWILLEPFTPENYRDKPAQLALVIDALSKKDHALTGAVTEKLVWVVRYQEPDGSQNVALAKTAMQALRKCPNYVSSDLIMGVNPIDFFIECLPHPDEEIRLIAVNELVERKVPKNKIEPVFQSESIAARDAARQILESLYPETKGTMFLSEEEARSSLFSYEKHHSAAQALRDFNQDKPWKEKVPAYLLSYLANTYIWLSVLLGIGSVILAITLVNLNHQVNKVYKRLLAYAGSTTFRERLTLKRIAVSLAYRESYGMYDPAGLIARNLPSISKTSKIKQIEKLALFLDKLNKSGFNSQYILEHGVPLVSRIAKDEAEFDKGLALLESLAAGLKLYNVDIRTVNLEANNLGKLIDSLAVFEAVCGFIKGSVSQNKQALSELLTAVVPDAFKGAKDANVKVERLGIIRQLVLGGLHPTRLLIETLQKTTSQSQASEQIAQWKKLLSDFKSGAVRFDPNNPLHVDLEYNTYRALAPQVSLSTSYKDYKEFIKGFHSSTGSASSLGNQEAGEIRLAVYEAYRLLEFIIAVKQKADKLGRPVWVVPNLSYGKFAVSPILDELARLGIEIHYAKVGSTECHNNPQLVKQGLFTDDVYQRILRERPVIIAVDGTKHLLARPNERKSSRYPDAYVGYRNLIVAVDDVLSGGNADAFHDRVRISTDFLNQLRQNSSDYNTLVSKLKTLASDSGQDVPLYRLEFWNPGGLQLVIREARQEVQNVTPFDPEHLDSPALIFINSPLLDEDIPKDIKKWSGLEGTHEPAFFDDRGQIQQNALAVNGRGLYLTHALEFETTRASQQLKGFYKGKLPQVEYKEPTPEAVRNTYEAMLFDLDGTLTDTLKDIDKALLDKLIYLLSSGVIIGIVTSQSLDEVREHILDRVDVDKKQHLGNLFLYANRGVQLYNFDGKANPILVSDRSQTDVTGEQCALIRNLINQALGTLNGSVKVIDRGAQLSIHLDKHKDKRDLVNTTLVQLIAANNLPFQTEYSGTSTIHVVLKGADKGSAKDNFLGQVFPSRLNRPVDLSKLLIVGDRFAQAGSDQPMVTAGARVVSVGKEKGLPAGVEDYPHHGWRGTDQLLGEIIHRAGSTTVSSPLSAFIGSLSLPDLWQSFGASLEGLYDASKMPLLYAGIATLGLAFIFVSTVSAIKLYKTGRLYREIIRAVSFLERKERIFLFREISRHVSWKKIQSIEPYQLFINMLPVLSKGIQDKRIQEINNAAARLRKAKINPRHVFKYCLPAISAKAGDEKQFANSLNLAERFALTLQDKHYDYHELLKNIMPQVERNTRSIDELNEAMLLGINLLKSGRNPTFALAKMLPEVVNLTKDLSDFKLGIYALQELCLAGFEPTRYLLAELIKQGTKAKIDSAVLTWQEIRRKFKTGDVAFNPKNELHVNLEYTTFRELVDRTLKQTHRYSYAEYLEILKNFNNGAKHASVDGREKAEVKFAAYEAYRLREFILQVKRQADKMGRAVWVVPNLSYGRFAVSPLLRDLAKDGIEVHYARIGSSESHEHPTLVKPDLFSANLYDRILNEQPVIIVVDGTQHLLARPKDRKSGRYPDAYVGYRNLIIAVNDIVSRGQEQMFKRNVKTSGHFIRDLMKKGDYKTLRRRLLRLFDPTVKTRRYLYDVGFWNPGGLELVIREDRQEVRRVRAISADDVVQPAMIFVNSAMLDEDVPVFMRSWITKGKKMHHLPAYFDDTSHIQRLIFNVDATGVSLSDALNENVRREYGRIKGIYQQRLKIPAKPNDLVNLPYKAVVSDLDGTLANTLEEVPKPVMEKLLYLLGLGVQVAIVTTQSYKEVERYLLSQVPAQNKALLSNLTIYAATGSQAYGFDKHGNTLPQPLYNTAGSELAERQMQSWRKAIDSIFKEYGLDREAKNKKGQVVAGPARLIDAGSQIIIRLKERGFLRREIRKRLQAALGREQLPIVLKEIGRTSIRMTIKGVDKSIAVKYHLTTVCKDRFGFEPKPGEVLILGNSFEEDGDDRDMMLKSARVFSVGGRPFLHYLRGGISFYPQGGWQGSNQLLAEFINSLSSSPAETPKPQAKPELVKLNSFNFLPFLAAGGSGVLENTDPFTSFIVGCLAGIIATVLIFRNRIFASDRPENEEDFKEEPQPNVSAQSAKPREKTPALTVRPVRRVLKPYDFDSAAQGIREQYPGIRIGVIGATIPARGYSQKIGMELGRRLRRFVGEGGFVFTGGVAGVGVDVYRGALEESQGKDDRFFALLPEDMDADYEYSAFGPRKVETVHFGRDMFERRIGMGKVADVVIILNGRGGTLHEAIAALEAGRKVIALDYGGAGSLLYHARARNELHPGLIQQGLRPEYFENIVLADLDNIEEALGSLQQGQMASTTTPNFIPSVSPTPESIPQAQLDPFAKTFFTVNQSGNMGLSRNAIYAINSLSQAYSGLTLEVDVDTLIDTSKGAPQLKGLGFTEALASLYQAQEKKQIPKNLRVRLININPRLNKQKIIKVLGLTEDLLKKMVAIPDIPEDYLIKTLEPYLIAGSVRIIFEDNVRYWGKKVDVLVRRGEETQTLSSLGLIVAVLAKEPKFYASLPAEVKEYIAAKTDEKGNIELDDEGKIKEIIFKPIEKTKVDTQYLEELDKANKELEGMA